MENQSQANVKFGKGFRPTGGDAMRQPPQSPLPRQPQQTAQQQQYTPQIPNPESPKKKKPIKLIISLIIAVVLIIVAIPVSVNLKKAHDLSSDEASPEKQVELKESDIVWNVKWNFKLNFDMSLVRIRWNEEENDTRPPQEVFEDMKAEDPELYSVWSDLEWLGETDIPTHAVYTDPEGKYRVIIDCPDGIPDNGTYKYEKLD